MPSATSVLVAFLAAIGPIAIAVTKAVDFVRSLVGSTHLDTPWMWNAMAFAIGVAYALAFQFNAMTLIPGLRQDVFAGWIGMVATGLSIGAAADFWHKQLGSKSVS